jgi:hypothetical protein
VRCGLSVRGSEERERRIPPPGQQGAPRTREGSWEGKGNRLGGKDSLGRSLGGRGGGGWVVPGWRGVSVEASAAQGLSWDSRRLRRAIVQDGPSEPGGNGVPHQEGGRRGASGGWAPEGAGPRTSRRTWVPCPSGRAYRKPVVSESRGDDGRRRRHAEETEGTAGGVASSGGRGRPQSPPGGTSQNRSAASLQRTVRPWRRTSRGSGLCGTKRVRPG